MLSPILISSRSGTEILPSVLATVMDLPLDDKPNSWFRSTTMISLLPSTFISMFFIIRSLHHGGACSEVLTWRTRPIVHMYFYFLCNKTRYTCQAEKICSDMQVNVSLLYHEKDGRAINATFVLIRTSDGR